MYWNWRGSIYCSFVLRLGTAIEMGTPGLLPSIEILSDEIIRWFQGTGDDVE